MNVTVLDREVYSMGEAARLLRVPRATLRSWIDGYTRAGIHYEPVIRETSTGKNVVTWGEFVEAGYLNQYRRRGVSLQSLRPVVQILRERLGVPYPLAHAKPYLSGRELVMAVQTETGLPAELAMVVIRNGQMVLDPRAEAFLRKVEFSPGDAEGAVRRLHPYERSRSVVIDPLRAFGAPAVRGVRTENIFELCVAGDSIEAIARSYDLSVAEVEAAVSYEREIA